MFRRSSIICKRSGITLIEVVATLLLVSTVLFFVLKTSIQNQKAFAEGSAKIHATRLADQLIARWVSIRKGIPANTTGILSPEFVWRTSEPNSVEGLPTAKKIDLIVSHKGTSGSRPLFTIELIDNSKPGEQVNE